MTQTTTDVARNLTTILRLWSDLEARAVALASAQVDGTSLPGGEAMVALGPVASIEAWGYLNDHAEATGHYDSGDYEDPDEMWPPYQIIRFWSERWRAERGEDYEIVGGYTIATEAAYVRSALDWAWDNELGWDDFAEDIKRAKTKVENIVRAGIRPAFKGAPCMYDGASLVRYTRPTSRKGRKVWMLSDWQCPRCRRTWDEDAYVRNLHAAGESLHYRNIDGETWWSTQRAAERIGRSWGTVRSWISRGQVASQTIDGRVYVYPPDVQARHALAIQRAERRLAAIKARRESAGKTTSV